MSRFTLLKQVIEHLEKTGQGFCFYEGAIIGLDEAKKEVSEIKEKQIKQIELDSK